MPRRGPEQAPLAGPPSCLGATFSPRPGHGRPGRLEPMLPGIASIPVIYVTGHRNPDTDSIAAAIGYAELMRRLDTRNDYVPVRLGDLNTQTSWVLQRAGAAAPVCLLAVMPPGSEGWQREF